MKVRKYLFPNTCKLVLLQVLLGILLIVLYAEFLHHLVVIGVACRWPTLQNEEGASRFLLVADPHLLGHRFGHWLDRLRREWAMKRSYPSTYNLLFPKADATFVLGDLTDEGEWTIDEEEMSDYRRRFDAIFHPDSLCPVISVVGNHDVGFHYKHRPEKQKLWDKIFLGSKLEPTSSVRLVRFDLGSDQSQLSFVLLNSMAFEGDHEHCDLCQSARKGVEKLKGTIESPILLQHFPLYRDNDLDCPLDAHAAIGKARSAPTRPRMDVLSKEASEYLMETFKPRVIISGHTHFSCKMSHRLKDGTTVDEYSVPSFSWRNNIAPAILLLVATKDEYKVETCAMANEHTIFAIYIFGGLFLLLFCILRPIFIAVLTCFGFFTTQHCLPAEDKTKLI